MMAPDACMKTSGRGKTMLQREIEEAARDGAKVLANAASANAEDWC